MDAFPLEVPEAHSTGAQSFQEAKETICVEEEPPGDEPIGLCVSGRAREQIGFWLFEDKR